MIGFYGFIKCIMCACVGCDGVVKKWVELVYGGRVKMTFKVCGRKTTPFTPNQDFFADWTNPTQQIHFREASKDILLHSHVEMYFAIITVSVPRVHFLKSSVESSQNKLYSLL